MGSKCKANTISPGWDEWSVFHLLLFNGPEYDLYLGLQLCVCVSPITTLLPIYLIKLGWLVLVFLNYPPDNSEYSKQTVRTQLDIRLVFLFFSQFVSSSPFFSPKSFPSAKQTNKQQCLCHSDA